MPSPTFQLAKSQISDIEALCDLGSAALQRIVEALSVDGPTIQPTIVKQRIATVVGPETAERISRVLLGLAMANRRAFGNTDELLKMLSIAVSKSPDWDNTKTEVLEQCSKELKALVSSPSIAMSAKAADLSTDFANTCIGTRMLTDLRPVFDDKRNEIIGITITNVLRIEYISPKGEENSVTISFDMDDIQDLKQSCEDALKKARKAKEFVNNKLELDVLLPGQDSE